MCRSVADAVANSEAPRTTLVARIEAPGSAKDPTAIAHRNLKDFLGMTNEVCTQGVAPFCVL